MPNRREFITFMSSAKANPEPLPKVVYHYTSIETMLKILKHNIIWATSINYLNDTSEGDHYSKLIRERIEEYVKSHLVAKPEVFYKVKQDPKLIGFDQRPFVTSFSSLPDFLPQWRSYCPQGNGVAIGFRTECLEQAKVVDKFLDGKTLEDDEPHTHGSKASHEFFLPRVRFGKVAYIDHTANETLDERIGNALQHAEWSAAAHLAQAGPSPIESEESILATQFERVIQSESAFIKNPSFSNEGEYRLVVDSTHWNRSLFGFRPTRSTLVPYLPVRIPRLHSGVPFVDHVILGPTPNEELSRQSVQLLLFNEGLKHAWARNSIVPYREW